jgi:hypothetical protein
MQTRTRRVPATSREARSETCADRLRTRRPFPTFLHEAGDSEALADTPDAGAAASRRARVPQVSASLRKPSGLRRSQRSRADVGTHFLR